MSAAEDAKTIRNAIKGLGTDDAKLVEVITKRTNEQLVSITAEYMTQFGKSIFDDIKGDTSGNYRDLLVALVEAKPIFIARTIHNAIKGAGTNESALIDAIVHQPNALIRAATEQYHKLFGKTAHDDVAGDTSGDFKRLCVGLLSGTRDENPVVNAALVQTDAENLYKKGEGRLGTDEEAFVEFFLNRSYAHIAEVDKAYTAKRGHGLVAAINGEFSGNIRKALKALALSRSDFWAYRIHQSLQGLGTNDSALIRAFVLNTRDQLKGIDAAYTARSDKKKSGKKSEKSGKEKKDKKDKKDKKKTVSGSLRADITGDTSGWYEKSLLSLLA